MFELDFIEQSLTYFENPSAVAVDGSWGWTGISEGKQIRYKV